MSIALYYLGFENSDLKNLEKLKDNKIVGIDSFRQLFTLPEVKWLHKKLHQFRNHKEVLRELERKT